MLQKPELVESVKEIVGGTKKDAGIYVSATMEAIAKAIKAGDDVRLAGLFAVTQKEVAEHPARNPQTGAQVMVPAHRKASIRLATGLRKF